MDRNLIGCVDRAIDIVALRKESVDRNYGSDLSYSDGVVSLSARRAGIEIMGLDGRFKL